MEIKEYKKLSLKQFIAEVTRESGEKIDVCVQIGTGNLLFSMIEIDACYMVPLKSIVDDVLKFHDKQVEINFDN